MTNLKLLSCLDNTAVKLDKCNFNFIPLGLIKNLKKAYSFQCILQTCIFGLKYSGYFLSSSKKNIAQTQTKENAKRLQRI